MQLDPRFRFDNFVVGSANRLAVAAARAVAEAPGAAYNPLFIYSASGLGKTHLMSAIGNHAQQLQPELGVAVRHARRLRRASCTPRSRRASARRSSSATWRVGVLLLDDIQFLAGRRETQSELLRIFNALQRERAPDRHDERSAAGRDRRRRRAADHAVLRRADRRHRRAGLRDAHGDPARASARSAASRSEPGVIEELGRHRVRQRARAAGRAQSADRVPGARRARRRGRRGRRAARTRGPGTDVERRVRRVPGRDRRHGRRGRLALAGRAPDRRRDPALGGRGLPHAAARAALPNDADRRRRGSRSGGFEADVERLRENEARSRRSTPDAPERIRARCSATPTVSRRPRRCWAGCASGRGPLPPPPPERRSPRGAPLPPTRSPCARRARRPAAGRALQPALRPRPGRAREDRAPGRARPTAPCELHPERPRRLRGRRRASSAELIEALERNRWTAGARGTAARGAPRRRRRRTGGHGARAGGAVPPLRGAARARVRSSSSPPSRPPERARRARGAAAHAARERARRRAADGGGAAQSPDAGARRPERDRRRERHRAPGS